MLRVLVQLVDTSTGAHLWAETYDRQFRAEEIFALQDDLVPRIVSTVADINGVLPRSMCEVVCSRSPDQLSPYEAVLRSFRYFDRVTPDELVSARSCLELAVEKAPTYADAWAMLAVLCVQDYAQEFNCQSDSLKRGATAAQRAVEAAPSNHLAYFSLAQAHFFQKEFQSFRNAADRAVALNPMDGNSLAYIGELLTYAGNGERGLALATRAKQINPNHPGWFWYADYFHAYRQGDYRGALSLILKANLPGHWGMHTGIAAAAGQLGEHETASKAVRDLLKLRPDFCTTIRNTLEKWFDPELREHLIDGLRKAGLEIADEISEPPDDTHVDVSTAFPCFESRTAIAVLPFVNISNERENEYFCDGLAEELLNALSKIQSLHVAARTSAFYFKGKQTNISEIGSRLNVSTVLEGSVRKSGNRVRISVQLVNVPDGYHLWSEKYDREMKDIFDIQDEISLAIVDALKLKLLGTEQSVVKRYTDNTEAYQLYLKGRFFVNQRTSASLLKAIDYFNQAITLDSNYPLGYAGLADAYLVLGVPDAVTEALSPRDSLSKARAAAEKAREIDPSVGEIYTTLAHIKWKERDWGGAENDYRRGIELNPQNPIAHFYYAVCLAGLGRCDDAVKEITRAQELDPLSLPVNASVVYVLYLCCRYDEAIEAGKKTLDLDAAFPLTHQRLGLPYTQKEMYREAIAEFEQAVNNSNRAPQPLMLLGHAYAVSGNKVEAQKVLAEIRDLSQERYVSPYGVAAIYVGLGEKEQAFEWLKKALDEDNTELTFLKVDPRLDPLRDDPRFQELLDRAGFPS
jgi:TolB-like protein/Tfp pilus assembly protein PilF